MKANTILQGFAILRDKLGCHKFACPTNDKRRRPGKVTWNEQERRVWQWTTNEVTADKLVAQMREREPYKSLWEAEQAEAPPAP